MQNEITNLIKVTINQKYFKINNTIWQQTNGTQIGSPIPSTLAEIFLQESEKKTVPQLNKRRHVQYTATC
jgi:hypothetical protein